MPAENVRGDGPAKISSPGCHAPWPSVLDRERRRSGRGRVITGGSRLGHAAAADIKQYFQFTDGRRSLLDPAFF